MSLHARLKQERGRLGLSQSALAKACGVSQPTIANWERGGQVPRQMALSRLADSLGVSKAWLLTGVSPAENHPAQIHLSKPIRNVPVFDWPNSPDAFHKAQPTSYLTVSADGDDLFAVAAPKGSDFQDHSVLVFDRRDAGLGTHLVQHETGFALQKVENGSGDNIMGRLVFSMQPH